jgi:hypothetical protein
MNGLPLIGCIGGRPLFVRSFGSIVIESMGGRGNHVRGVRLGGRGGYRRADQD